MVEKPKRDLKMKFAFKKGSLSNILKFCSIAMSIVLFFFSVWVFVYDLYPELKSGYFNIATFFAGTTSAAGCAISALVAKSLLKIKVLKETYFFIVFVFSSSALSFIVADFAFGIDVQPSLLVGFWIILGTILSYVISGNTPRELIRNIWRLVLRNGVSILTILLLASLPIIEILPSFQTFSLSCSGTIEYQNIGFENSKGITHESGDGKTVFIKEIPLSFDRIFIDSQIVDIKNPSISDLDLKIQLEGLDGNLSKVEQFSLYFILSNGTKITSLKIESGTISYYENIIRIGINASAQVGLYFVQNMFYADQQNVRIQITLDETTNSLSYSISFLSAR